MCTASVYRPLLMQEETTDRELDSSLLAYSGQVQVGAVQSHCYYYFTASSSSSSSRPEASHQSMPRRDVIIRLVHPHPVTSPAAPRRHGNPATTSVITHHRSQTASDDENRKVPKAAKFAASSRGLGSSTLTTMPLGAYCIRSQT